MKYFFYIVVLIFGLALEAFSQCQRTNNLNISTGYNPVSNSILTGGTASSPVIDPLWRLVNLPPIVNDNDNIEPWSNYPQVAIGQAYVVQRLNLAWGWNNNNNNNEMPISPNWSEAFGSNNFERNQPFRLVRQFCVLDESEEIVISLNIKGDDVATVSLIDANGNSYFRYTTRTGTSNVILPGTPNFDNTELNGWSYNNTSSPFNLNPGTYSIVVELVNTDGYSMGFTISGSISTISTNNNLANPPECCSAGTIGLQKILDEYCNGRLDTIDTHQEGIVFHLKDNSNSVISTSQTNQAGELFFYNVPYGTYTIEEIVPSGYAPFGSNNQQITINQQNPIQYLTFYNCIRDPFDCCNSELMAYFEPGSPEPIIGGVTNGVPNSIATEKLGIHQDATIPITEFRVSITDIQFDYNYESCAECMNNPAIWGSIVSTTSKLEGKYGNALSFPSMPFPMGFTGSFFNTNGTPRELIWTNSDGAMLEAGTEIEISFHLPPVSEIPCCATSTRICTKISWKDANCNVCERFNCTTINLEPKNN